MNDDRSTKPTSKIRVLAGIAVAEAVVQTAFPVFRRSALLVAVGTPFLVWGIMLIEPWATSVQSNITHVEADVTAPVLTAAEAIGRDTSTSTLRLTFDETLAYESLEEVGWLPQWGRGNINWTVIFRFKVAINGSDLGTKIKALEISGNTVLIEFAPRVKDRDIVRVAYDATPKDQGEEFPLAEIADAAGNKLESFAIPVPLPPFTEREK